VSDPEVVLAELEACRDEHPDSYIRLNGYDSVRQGQVLAFVVHQPAAA
jgi:ribulose-bisphosphate carboxylase small chain